MAAASDTGLFTAAIHLPIARVRPACFCSAALMAGVARRWRSEEVVLQAPMEAPMAAALDMSLFTAAIHLQGCKGLACVPPPGGCYGRGCEMEECRSGPPAPKYLN